MDNMILNQRRQEALARKAHLEADLATAYQGLGLIHDRIERVPLEAERDFIHFELRRLEKAVGKLWVAQNRTLWA